HLPFVGGVKLVPDRLAARGAHVLDPEAGRGRQNLQMVADLGGARGGDLASSWKDLWPPTGASTIGRAYFTPRISVDMSTLVPSTSRRGRSWNFKKPSRLARSVTSSSMPEAM